MKEIKNHIRKKTKIYSLEHGVGEIVGILRLYDGVQDYIEVRFSKNVGVLNLYPADYQNELRIITNPLNLTRILKKLSSEVVNNTFIERSRFHQRIGGDVSLDSLINIIGSLIGTLNLEMKDRNLLSNCVESLILEVSHVYKISELSAKGIVSDYMRAA